MLENIVQNASPFIFHKILKIHNKIFIDMNKQTE